MQADLRLDAQGPSNNTLTARGKVRHDLEAPCRRSMQGHAGRNEASGGAAREAGQVAGALQPPAGFTPATEDTDKAFCWLARIASYAKLI